MKPAHFHPEAEVELLAESRYYEERVPGLGQRFIKEVEQALQLASEFPKVGVPYKHGTRRIFPKSFPFSIVYQELDEKLVILALAPFPRRPAYWRHRRSRG